MDEIRINQGKMYRCPRKTRNIRCLDGIIHITYERSNDIILKPGEESQVLKKRQVIVTALEPSTVIIYA